MPVFQAISFTLY